MQLGKKGWSGGATIMVGAFITMFVLVVISSATMYSGGINPFSSEGIIQYYTNLFSSKNLANPIPMVLSFFVPFIATFAMTWAFIGILPVFKDYTNKNADRGAALLALSTSLITTPSSSLFFLNFWPWSMGFMVLMIAVGFIGKGLHVGIGSVAEAYTGVRETLPPGSPGGNLPRDDRRELTERKERDDQAINDFAVRWNQALSGYIDSLDNRRIRPINIGSMKGLARFGEWINLCNSLENLERARQTAVGTSNTMMQALQNPREFRNLFRDQYLAAGLLNELQNSIREINDFRRAAIENLEKVSGVLTSRVQKQRGSTPIDASTDLPLIWRKIEEYLNRYREFSNWQHSATGDINTLRTRTIDLLGLRS